MWKSRYILIAVMVLLGLVFVSTLQPGKASTADNNQPVRHMTMDELLAEVGRRVPAFGGMFLEPKTNEFLNIYLLDPRKKEAAGTALKEVFGASIIPAGGVKVLQAQYSISQLKAWYDPFWKTVISLPGVIMTDLDEGHNRLTIGIENAAASELVKEKTALFGIPPEAVVLEIMEPIRLVTHQTL